MREIKEGNTPMVQATPEFYAVYIPVALAVAKLVVNFLPIIYTMAISYCAYYLMWYFWVWIIDYYGYIEMDWLWDIIDPDRGDEIDGTDKWVQMNTSLVGVSIVTLAKAKGVRTSDFDLTDSENMRDLIMLSYPLLYGNMMPSITLAGIVDMTQMFWFYFFPDAYADEK